MRPLNQSFDPGFSWPLAMLILALALAARLLMLLDIVFDSDMAMTGIMGRHILAGEAFPIFFYGQPFCGSLEAYVAAGLFFLFGSSPVTLSLAPILLSLVFVLLVLAAVGDMSGRRAGIYAGLLAAIPPFYFLWHCVLPRAAYIEIPLISLLIMWTAYRISQVRAGSWLYFALGLLAGLGFWTHPLIGYTFAACGVYLALTHPRIFLPKPLLLALLGLVIGASPLIIYNLQNEWLTFAYLIHGGPGGDTPAWEVMSGFCSTVFPNLVGALSYASWDPLLSYFSHFIWAFCGLGILVVVWASRYDLLNFLTFRPMARHNALPWLLLLIFSLAVAIWHGESPYRTHRHFVPLYTALLPLLGCFLAVLHKCKPLLCWLALALLLFSNTLGILQHSLKQDSSLYNYHHIVMERAKNITSLMAFNQIDHAYTFAWNHSMLFSFLSNEKAILVQPGALPYPEQGVPVYNRRLQADPQINYLAVGSGEIGFMHKMQTLHQAQYEEKALLPDAACFVDIKPLVKAVRLIDLSQAEATASGRAELAANALDDDALTRWSTMQGQKAGDYFQLDLGRVQDNLCRLRLLAGLEQDYPRGLLVETSLDGQNWQTAVVIDYNLSMLYYWSLSRWQTGGYTNRWDVDFPPRPARYIRLTQTGDDRVYYWSIQEISLYQALNGQDYDPDVKEAAQELTDFWQSRPNEKIYTEPWLYWLLAKNAFPEAGPVPRSPHWPLELHPHFMLPKDMSGAVLATEISQAHNTNRLLKEYGFSFNVVQLKWMTVFYDIKPHFDMLVAEPVMPVASAEPAAFGSGRAEYVADFAASRKLGGVILHFSQNQTKARVLLSDDGQAWREVETQPRLSSPFMWSGDRLLLTDLNKRRLEFIAQSARYLKIIAPAQAGLNAVTPLTPEVMK